MVKSGGATTFFDLFYDENCMHRKLHFCRIVEHEALSLSQCATHTTYVWVAQHTWDIGTHYFSNFSCMFLNPNISSISSCFNLLDMRNFQEQVKKALCYQKLLWPFTVWKNCSSDLKNFANSRPSASNFKSFSWSLAQFFLTVGQNNFGNKLPFLFIEG